MTNGHSWVLVEISNDGVKKTAPIYSPKSKMIYEDENCMKSIVGMLRYALQIEENIVETNIK